MLRAEHGPRRGDKTQPGRPHSQPLARYDFARRKRDYKSRRVTKVYAASENVTIALRLT